MNSDPREIDNTGTFNDDIQLLQINVDEYIIFGDTGIVHVFIPKKDLKKKDFKNAYFFWDCS